MTLPPISGDATLNNAPFRQAIGEMHRDLLGLLEVSKKLGTIRITADLSAGKDAQKMTRAIRDAVNEMVPTDMQRRINTMFGDFGVGAGSAAQSASAFNAQASALRERIEQLDRAVRITRAQFQSGFGEASQEEVSQLSQEMRRLQQELEQVGQEARENFGEYSREALRVANANRLAETTAAAARGEISRLGLASQVRLGAGAALQQYGPQATGAANGLFQFALASDKARISQALFAKTVEKTGQSSEEAQKVIATLMDTLQVSQDDAAEAVRGLLRQGYTLKQAQEALTGAGASALAFGRSAAEGMNAFVDASTSMSSAALNNIGISENLSTFYQSYARSLGKTTDELTKQEKAEAELRLIRAATTDEVGDLTALLGGMSGQASSASRELNEAQKALGETLVPLATNGIRTLTGILDVFNRLPDPVKETVTILGASAVAIGILAAPVSGLVNGLKSVMGAATAAQTATAATAAVENVATAATTRFNVVTTVKKVLLMDVGVAYAAANRQAMLYSGSMAASATMTSTLSASVTTLGATLKGAAAAISIYTVAATAALGLGLYWNEQVKQTTKIYEDIDAANQASFEKTMKRVEELRKSGTKLGRAQAKYLLATQRLADAEAGTPTGKINWITGEREIKRDEQAIARLRAERDKARESMVYYYTEAQRRGATNVVLTDKQTKAVQELNKALEGRRYDLKVAGMTELGADLAKLQKDFEGLRQEFKKPFTVNGKLMDPAQTPALREGLAQLDAQLAAEQARLRKKYADEAVKTAKESALAVQEAEISAMREGAAKRRAQRQSEIDEINRSAKEKAASLSDFPKQAAQVEADARRLIAAKRRGWALEDEQLAEESSKKIQDAQVAARNARIAAMADGYAKEEALRRAALDDLRRSIDEQVKAETDPRVRQGLRAQGDAQLVALQQQQNRERLRAIQEGQQAVREATRRGRDAEIAAMAEGTVKAEAQRRAELDNLRADYAERIRLETRPEVKAALRQEAGQAEQAKLRQQARQRLEEQQQAQEQVAAMERQTRSATIAAMRDGVAKEEATRAAALESLRADLQKQVDALAGSPVQQARVIEEGTRLITATIAQQAEERRRAYVEAQRVVDDATRAARDASVSAMQDSYKKEVLVRQNALDDLVSDLNRQAEEFKGSEAQRQEFVRQANRQVLGLYNQQQRELRELQREATRQVTDAERSARAAEIEGIREETAKKRAARREELRDLQRQTAETLRTFKGTEQQAQQIRDAARREQQAKQAAWNLEDERTARAAALRIAQAWQEVSNKQFAAQQAGRDATLAQYNLDVSRRLGGVSGVNDDPVARARIEQEAATRRAQLAQQNADKQLAQDRANLEKTRDIALSAEHLTAEEKRLIWEGYYADLRKLDSDYQSGNRQRLQQQEEAERQAAENMRQARIKAADKPIEQSQTRQSELERSKALATSDAEVLAINTRISQERQNQLAALQGQLDGIGGVTLSAEERERVEERIRTIQHDQAASLKEQEQLVRDVTDSTLSRLNAEAQLSERLAKTEADRVAAQQRQLAVAQLRVSKLDRQILAEGREKERNALIEQRFGVLGQIADLQDKIRAAPLEAERRRLDLSKQLAATELGLKGLGENELATAEQAVEFAAQELLYANARVAAARTEAELQAALSEQAGARLALVRDINSQANAKRDEQWRLEDRAQAARKRAEEAMRRQLDLENGLLDAAEARASAMLQIRGMADDAVASAERELRQTRERLTLTARQLNRGGLAAADEASLLKERVGLLGQQAEQERKLFDTQLARRDLLEALADAEGKLRQEAAGGRLTEELRVNRQLTDARSELAKAERAYAEAKLLQERIPSTANAEKLKGATERLTGAIKAQREAVRALAESYRAQLSEQKAVQDATKGLSEVVLGDKQPFNGNREIDRLRAYERSRDQTLRALDTAITGGDKKKMAELATRLKEQEQRYREQIKLLEKQGINVSRNGAASVDNMLDRLENIGLEYDKEEAALQERARLTDLEADNALTIKDASAEFADSVSQLEQNTRNLVDALNLAYQQLQNALRRVKSEGDQEAARQEAREQIRIAAQRQGQTFTPQSLDALAGKIAEGVKVSVSAPPAPAPQPDAYQKLLDYLRQQQAPSQTAQLTVTRAVEAALSGLARMNVTYTPLDEAKTAPANHTVNYHIEIGDTHITASNPVDAKRQLDGWWEGKMRELKQKRAWEPKQC